MTIFKVDLVDNVVIIATLMLLSMYHNHII